MSMIYRWHSINIIPNFSIYHVAENIPGYNDCRFLHSVVQITVFGIIFAIDIPFKLPYFSTEMRGPCWSRRKKIWYFPE